MDAGTPDIADAQAQTGPDGSGPLIIRDLRVARDTAVSRAWLAGDPAATALFNSLSIVFPHGEAFFIESLKPWRDRVPPRLAEEISGFIRQEVSHSREHLQLNKQLGDAGYDISRIEAAVRRVLDAVRRRGMLFRLEATMCLEHVTAIVAAEVLGNPSRMAGADREQHRLWIWHAIEEIEHKAVAFDAWSYAHARRSGVRRWLSRSLAMIVLTAGFTRNRIVGQFDLLAQDGITGRVARRAVWRTTFARGGLIRAVARPWMQFFRPGFHPWATNDRHLIASGEAMLRAFDAPADPEAMRDGAADPAPTGKRQAAA